MRGPARAPLAAAGVAAVGALAGALAEHRLVRGTVRPRAQATRLPTLDGLRQEIVTCDDGTALAVRESGPGQARVTVVYVHGYTVSADCWAAQVQAMADLEDSGAIRQVLYDQRGHGASERGPDSHHTLEQLGADLAEVIRQRAPDGPVVLIGHSMGGMTIMALAEQCPELFGDRIVAVALVSTSSGGMSELSLGLPTVLARIPSRLMPYASKTAAFHRRIERLRAPDSDLARWINAMVSFGPGASGAAQEAMTRMQAAMKLETMAAFMPTFLTHERAAALSPLKGIPTLILVGEHDVLTPVDHSRKVADALPDAQFVVAAGVGHMVMMEAPEEVTQHLRHLIERAL